MEGISIQVRCQGATTVAIDELHDLQGDLKDLTEENYVKLRNSIVKRGIRFPFFVWVDQDGKKWIIDAHQRTRVLRKMKEEGHEIPLLPADLIEAKDMIEAKELLLLANSRYGTMTQEGFDTFIADIPMDDLKDDLEIPEIMIDDQPENLVADNESKPFSIKIVFRTGEDLQNAKVEIEEIVAKYQNASLSVSAGEL